MRGLSFAEVFGQDFALVEGYFVDAILQLAAGWAAGGVEFVACSGLLEFGDVDVAEGRGSAELMCGEADLGEVLDGFGLHEGVG